MISLGYRNPKNQSIPFNAISKKVAASKNLTETVENVT